MRGEDRGLSDPPEEIGRSNPARTRLEMHEEITLAADRLEAMIGALPSDQWGEMPWGHEACSNEAMGYCRCIVFQGEYKSFDQPQDPMIQYIADAENEQIAQYLTTMGPEVGKLLVKSLRSSARVARPGLIAHDLFAAELGIARAINARFGKGKPDG